MVGASSLQDRGSFYSPQENRYFLICLTSYLSNLCTNVKFGIKKMKQKEGLEYYAIINFIREYNRTHKKKFIFHRLNNPPMPDTFCELNGREIGIEIVHSYGSGIEAAIRLGNRKTSDFPKKRHRDRRTTPINARALNSLNERLYRKSKKKYSFFPVWLLIRNAFAPCGLKYYKQHKKDIFIPDTHPFKQIWLLCDENSIGLQGIMRLA